MDTDLYEKQEQLFAEYNNVYYFGVRFFTWGMEVKDMAGINFTKKHLLIYFLLGILGWYCGNLFYVAAFSGMDLKTVVYIAFICVQMFALWIKAIFFFKTAYEIDGIMLRFNEYHCTQHRRQHAVVELAKRTTIIKRIMLFYQILMLFVMSTFIAEPFITYLIDLFQTTRMSEITWEKVLEILYFPFETTSAIIATLAAVSFNCFFGIVGYMIYAQFNILNESIVNYETEGVDIPWDTHYHVKNNPDFELDDLKPMDISKFRDDHNKLIGICQKLQSVWSPFVNLQLLTSVLSFTLMAFFLVNNGDSQTKLLEPAGEIMIATFELSIYCAVGSLVKQATESVAFALYRSDWLTDIKNSRASMQILVIASQRPVILTAFKTVIIDLPTIIDIMNMSYSYYTVLSRMSTK